MRPAAALRIAITSCLAVACGELSVPLSEVPQKLGPSVVTDSLNYHRGAAATARFSLTNQLGLAVYLGCPMVSHQFYDDGQWHDQPMWYAFPPCGPAVRVAVTDTIRGTLPLTNSVVPKSGWYRIVFAVYEDSARVTLWPVANRVSEAFFVGP